MELCSYHHYIILGHFHQPQKETPYQLVVTPITPPCSPWQPLTQFLSLEFCLFQTEWNCIIRVLFWLASLLKILFSSFIRILVCISTSVLFIVGITFSLCINHICLLISWKIFRLFPFFFFFCLIDIMMLWHSSTSLLGAFKKNYLRYIVKSRLSQWSNSV